MATVLISHDERKNLVRQKLGMTGELTLTGRVLPIGGPGKDHSRAPCGLKVLIFPEGNRKDFDDPRLPEGGGWRCTLRKEYKDVYRGGVREGVNDLAFTPLISQPSFVPSGNGFGHLAQALAIKSLQLQFILKRRRVAKIDAVK